MQIATTSHPANDFVVEYVSKKLGEQIKWRDGHHVTLVPAGDTLKLARFGAQKSI
ncbi:hypothetical protein [Bradyrhizobium zhanjiangense]|uniref:hypothetical protein n=1 Tax=Bradyrhizobium zhanjiangense TaxID=1325107 RepID=UPI0013E8DB3D|nr:hypothetical protein [Bradyrhizobium zhanjiangense]